MPLLFTTYLVNTAVRRGDVPILLELIGRVQQFQSTWIRGPILQVGLQFSYKQQVDCDQIMCSFFKCNLSY